MIKKKRGFRSPTCTLSCPCGAPIIVDRRRPEGIQVCVVCHQSLRVVVATDPRTRRRQIGIVVSPQAVTTVTRAVKSAGKRGATKKRPRPETLAGVQNPTCACGAQVAVNLATVDAVYTCSWCTASYTAVGKPDPATGAVSPVLMPVQAVPLEKEAPRKPVKPEGAFLMTPDVIGAQPLVMHDGDGWMLCSCGHEIKVDPSAAQQERKCPGCGLSFQIVLAADPATRKPMVISLPRAKPAAREMTA